MENPVKHPFKSKHYERIVEKRFANYKMMLYFALLSITVLFITLSILYIFSKGHQLPDQKPLEIHPAFFINTLFMAISSMALYFTQQSYKQDDYENYKITLGTAFVSGSIFIIGQLVAWYFLWVSGYQLNHSSAAYLYVISGLHGVHMLGGLIFMTSFFVKALFDLKDFPTSIIYFTNPVTKYQLANLSLYWHFMGALWVYLMLFFLIAK